MDIQYKERKEATGQKRQALKANCKPYLVMTFKIVEGGTSAS